MYKFHKNRKRVLNMQVYYSFLFMWTLYGACTTWARICSTSEAYHQYQWKFLVQVKCIISMNKIWSASKAHHEVLGKGGTYFVWYTGEIFPSFDELYMLIILYSIQLEMLCTFPVKSTLGCKIYLYFHSSLFAININVGAEWHLFPISKKLWECCIWKQLLSFSRFKSRKYWLLCSIVN